MPTIETRPRCRHCHGTIILPDEDGKLYCLACRRPFYNFRDFGRIGGIQTVLRYGRDYMAELGRRSGLSRRLPTLAELRQQSAPKAQFEIKGGNQLPHRLSELKELWKERRGGFRCK